MNITIKTEKRGLVITVYSVIIILAVIMMMGALIGLHQKHETLAAWQPTTKPADLVSHGPTACSTGNSAAMLTRSNEAAVLGGTGGTTKEGPQNSYYSRGWGSEGQWWQLSGLSTQGFEHIELSFFARGSNTGPRDFRLEYSTDGTNWRPLTDGNNVIITYVIDTNNRFHQQGPYQLSDAISNIEVLYIRFFNYSTQSVSGGTTQSSGTSYITDITITGTVRKAG